MNFLTTMLWKSTIIISMIIALFEIGWVLKKNKESWYPNQFSPTQQKILNIHHVRTKISWSSKKNGNENW